MAAKVITGTYPSGYYLDPAFQVLEIENTVYVGGTGVTTSSADPSRISNDGEVQGSQNGISLADGGAVTNETGAYIGPEIKISGARGVVTNEGSIGGTRATYSGYGGALIHRSIDLYAGGTVENGRVDGTTATIKNRVYISGSSGSVLNNGIILGSVNLSSGGKVVNGTDNDTSAEIERGVIIEGGHGSISNTGTILRGYAQNDSAYPSHGAAIQTTTGVSIVNSSSGTINGVVIRDNLGNGGKARIENDGNINIFSSYTGSYNAIVGGSVHLTNSEDGMINGISLLENNPRSEITNQGTIIGLKIPQYYGGYGYYPAISMQSGGSIVNGSASNSAARLTNGVYATFGKTEVINYGLIDGSNSNTALVFRNTEHGSDTLVEEGSGKLEGQVYGGGDSNFILAGDAGSGNIGGFGSTITDFRSIDVVGGSDWTFTQVNTITSGVELSDEGTLHVADSLRVNGTFDITGTTDLGSDGQLVNLANGKVILADAASVTGEPSGSAADVTNSGLIEKTTGSGIASLEGGMIQNDGTIQVKAGTLDIAGPISGSTGGALRIGASGTLELGAAVDATQKVVFQDTSGTLQLDEAEDFSGSISGFTSGDTIKLADIARTGAKLAFTENAAGTQGTLTVTNGVQMATLTFDGDYSGDSFRLRHNEQGGSNLVYLAPKAQAFSSGSDPALTQALFDGAFGGGLSETHAAMTSPAAVAPITASLDHPGAPAKV